MTIGPADLPVGLPVPQDAAPTVADLDRLLAECVERAGRAIEADGDFWPFSLCVTTDGRLAEPRIAVEREDPEPEDVLRLLRGSLRSGRDGLRAAAVCSDVQVRRNDVPDAPLERALQVELQARGGDALALLVPYARPDGPRPVFSTPVGRPGEHPTWD